MRYMNDLENINMIYMDNASTTWKKPPSVSNTVYRILLEGAGNPGRGANAVSLGSSGILLRTRGLLMELFQAPQPENVIFKASVTDALNTLLLGLLKPGDHVISSVMEHNSVLRPLEHLKQKGIITYDLLGADEEGRILLQELPRLEKPETRAVILSHVSNLTGTLQPLEEVRGKLKNKEIFILADAAQSAGYLPVGLISHHLDAIAYTGHKGLLGPQGTGGFVLNDRLNAAMDPVFTGGTGSDSLSLNQPLFLPDKFESGTQNVAGIAGLAEGLKYIKEISLDIINQNHQRLTERFLDALQALPGITLHGPSAPTGRVPNFSMTFASLNPSEAAFRLEQDFGIIVRSGYHCAPLAHKAMGTLETGSVRISFGHFTTEMELIQLIQALRTLCEVPHGRLS